MFVLLLLHTTLAINLTTFENFQVEFDSKCRDYFLLQSETEYVYFQNRNGNFELWYTQGDNYSLYTSPWTELLIFEWPKKIINNNTMNLVLHEGSITNPGVFDTEFVLCDIKGVMGGTLFYQETTCESVKCPPSNTWKLNLLGYCIGLLILLLLGTNAHNETIQTDISRIFSRVRGLSERYPFRRQPAPLGPVSTL